jgi:hypothetical protein
MDDPVIRLMASIIVRMHGIEAAFFAAQNAEMHVANCDQAGAALWKKILHAIDELQAPLSSQTIN